LAAAIGARIGGEVVGCDAVQVYRGFDAATAKPTPEERRGVPHFMLDVADPRHDYSVADYVREADAAIAGIVARGAIPIVVGGTGMYLRGLLKGVVPAPPRDLALRDRLRRMGVRFGARRLHRLLARLDPESASRLPPGDTQRVVRALELACAPGPTWSQRLRGSGTWSRSGERYAALKLGLDLDRAVHRHRLAHRVDGFFSAGLVDEVERLISGGVPPTANAFKAIGYREVVRARAEGTDPRGERDAIVAATVRLAKRQRTWFRKEPDVSWLDAALSDEILLERVHGAWAAFASPGGAGSLC